MKARIKKTGAIWEFNKVDETIYESDIYGHLYRAEELEPLEPSPHTPDYWTRLEHQYAGMAMQGILVNEKMMLDLHQAFGKNESMDVTISEFAVDIAHTLVEKMKEERK